MKISKKTIIISVFLFMVFCLSAYLISIQRNPNAEFAIDHATRAGVSMGAFDDFAFENLRDFAYQNGTTTATNYSFQAYNVFDVQSVTYHTQYLDERKLFAHGFLTFDMGEQYDLYQHIGVSLEARKVQGTDYSALRGLLPVYDVIFVWATERDLVSRRTDLYKKPIDSHVLDLDDEQMQNLLRSLINETITSEQRTQRYNSLTHNCVNAMVSIVNKNKTHIPWHYSLIFTGLFDEYLSKLGLTKN